MPGEQYDGAPWVRWSGWYQHGKKCAMFQEKLLDAPQVPNP
jgi:hypothetical protein